MKQQKIITHLHALQKSTRKNLKVRSVTAFKIRVVESFYQPHSFIILALGFRFALSFGFSNFSAFCWLFQFTFISVSHFPTMEEIGLGALEHAEVVQTVAKATNTSNHRLVYTKYTSVQRYQIGKYASENG